MRQGFLFLIFPFTLSYITLSKPQTEDEYVKFEIKNAGVSVEGMFERFESTITYDQNNPNECVFLAKIFASSINTGIELRDEHLVEKDEFFNADRFKYLTFQSTRVELLTNGKLKVEGTLTIKENSQAVVWIITPIEMRDVVFFETSFELNRLDFDVGESSWMMADEVICSIRAKVST